MALKQHADDLTQQYKQLSADNEQLCQIVMDIRSQMGVAHVRPLFGCMVPGTTSLL